MNHEEKETKMKNNKKHRRIVKNAMQQSVNLHNRLESSRRTLEFFQQMIQRFSNDEEEINQEQIEAISRRIRYEARMCVELGGKVEQLGKILHN
jgi:hypothetical protein